MIGKIIRGVEILGKATGIGTTKYENDRFCYIEPYVRDKDVLDIGVVQHNVNKTKNDDWLHGLISNVSSACVGIDILESEIKELADRGYDVHVENAESFDLDQQFDVVVAGEIIEHLSNFDGFLKSINKHLVDGGTLIITTPNAFFYRRQLEILLNGSPTVNPEHTCWFDEVTLKQLLERYGFSTQTIYYTSSEWRYRNLKILPQNLRNSTVVAISEKIGDKDER